MPTIKKVLLVGHCGFDGSSLRRAVSKALPDVKLDAVNDQRKLTQQADSSTLLLVNRVLDGRFESESGVDLIGELAAGDDPPKMMLVSNYADAQAEAEGAGALPGFREGRRRQRGDDAAASRSHRVRWLATPAWSSPPRRRSCPRRPRPSAI